MSAFQLLCFICCLIIVTSYNFNRRPSYEDRDTRAVTEWRFRRTGLSPYSHFLRNHVLTYGWPGNDADADDSHSDEQALFPSDRFHRLNKSMKK